MYCGFLDPAISSDPSHSGMDADDVAVTNIDDDSPGVLIQPTSGLTVTEAGGSATFTVVLKSGRTADVAIALSSDDTAEGTVSPASLSFTPANWFHRQTVTVTGVNDFRVDGDVSFQIVTSATSADATYNGVIVDNVKAKEIRLSGYLLHRGV